MKNLGYGSIVAGKQYRSGYAKQITDILTERGEISQKDLALELGISASTLANHLKKLSDLVTKREEGRNAYYSLLEFDQEQIEFLKQQYLNSLNMSDVLTQYETIMSFLFQEVLQESTNVNAQFISENLLELINRMSFSKVLLLLHFQGIVSLDDNTLANLFGEDEIDEVTRDILEVYYEMVKNAQLKMLSSSVRERIHPSINNDSHKG